MALLVALGQLLWILVVRWPYAAVASLLPKTQKDVSQDTVLITGGASGLGLLLAERFAHLGASLVLWDVDERALRAAADDLCGRFPEIKLAVYAVDVSDRAHVHTAARQTLSEVGPVTMLVNNAGIVAGGGLLDADEAAIERVFQVNTLAQFWTIRAFLPGMIEAGRGHVVTIASSAGLIGVANLAPYCASKAALVSLDESLRFELAKMGVGDVIKTTCICPYAVSTGMFSGFESRYSQLLPILRPEAVVDKMLRLIRTETSFATIPGFLSLVFSARNLFPTTILDAAAEWAGFSNAMDNFQGRHGNAGKST
eukprot:m.290267 g.290267  ORF g.290267 m.290267 type:complete len:312 (+) comp12259_c0_seq1:2-937(+)